MKEMVMNILCKRKLVNKKKKLDMGRVCHGPSLYGPSLLWAEFVMGRVCYGPSCPVTP